MVTTVRERDGVEREALLSSGAMYNESPGVVCVDKGMDAFVDRVGMNRFHYVLIGTLGLANLGDATEIISMGYIIASKTFTDEFGDNDDEKRSLTVSIFFGMLFGGLLVSVLGDNKIGRRPLLLASLLINAIAGVLAAMSPSLWMITVFRSIAGVGVGGSVPCLWTLGAELTPPARRGYLLTIIGWFWMVGSIVTSVLAILILNTMHLSWRVFSFTCAMPSVVCFILVLFYIPESPRYLLVKQRFEETAAALNWIASYDSAQQHITDEELIEHHNSMNPPLSRSALGEDTSGFGVTTAFASFYRQVKSVYGSIKYRRTLLLLQSLWFCLSFSNYGLITWIETVFKKIGVTNPFLAAFFFAAGSLPGNILSTWLIETVGPRSVMIWSMALGAALLLAFAGQVANDLTGTETPSVVLIVITAALFNGCATASWNALDVMSSETFPTSVRSTVIGLQSSSGRVGAMVAQLVNATLSSYPFRLLVVAAITMVFGVIATGKLPDMKGKQLDDVMIDGEKTSDDDERTDE